MKNSKIYFAILIMVLTVIFCLASCGKKGVYSEKSENNAGNESENTINIIDTNNHETDNIIYNNREVNESEILAFFDMTFGEIINAGYELNYLYSHQGPGAPVYELDSEIGVLLMFSAEEADEYKVQDDSKPYRIIINNPKIALFGLKIGMLSEEENKVISEWDHSGCDFLHIGVYYTKKTIDDYSITAFREATIEDLKIFCLKNNITFSEEDYKSDFVQYEIIPMFAEEERINPRSNILSLEIEKINKKGEK